ncbi:glutathione S-transferase family protein [Sphingomonas baiyangensis]|uniref:Glutathione S-transferase n=1 Tax=Sphingomonas baiyangensis TaxID=2572576 RepID=A0A4U1L8S0_9SPHN|nr:glutathione S-transferase N-terminal domain-containing protein [Sphingomonas baiyangensis]TKD53224.1 glutathione S-transferase [Sphingomonas baiyangensis]
MRLYDSPWAPSPRRVRMFLAEKGLDIDCVAVDLRAGANLAPEYLRVNARGCVPALELDDGEVLCESAAICRYLEALHPEPSLFGATPIAIGRIEAWTRRIEGDGYAAAGYALRNAGPAFKDRGLPGKWPPVAQIPELATRALVMWTGFVDTLDEQLASNEWVAGEAYSFADITALVTIDFARAAKLVVPERAANILRWHKAASARPSAGA